MLLKRYGEEGRDYFRKNTGSEPEEAMPYFKKSLELDANGFASTRILWKEARFHLLPRWMLHPQPIGLDGEEIETVCELKGLALRRTYG